MDLDTARPDRKRLMSDFFPRRLFLAATLGLCAAPAWAAAPPVVTILGDSLTAGYARDFDAVVPALARAEGVPAYADLLGAVREDRALMQGDGVHPNARGVKVVVAKLAPAVAAALRSRR